MATKASTSAKAAASAPPVAPAPAEAAPPEAPPAAELASPQPPASRKVPKTIRIRRGKRQEMGQPVPAAGGPQAVAAEAPPARPPRLRLTAHQSADNRQAALAAARTILGAGASAEAVAAQAQRFMAWIEG